MIGRRILFYCQRLMVNQVLYSDFQRFENKLLSLLLLIACLSICHCRPSEDATNLSRWTPASIRNLPPETILKVQQCERTRPPWSYACAAPRSPNRRSSIPCAATTMTTSRSGATNTSTITTKKAIEGGRGFGSNGPGLVIRYHLYIT